MAQQLTNYMEIQRDEIEALRSIYMEDFEEEEIKTGAWNVGDSISLNSDMLQRWNSFKFFRGRPCWALFLLWLLLLSLVDIQIKPGISIATSRKFV